ncbi:MAG: efflux RND transporter periplasmic adaptor subunit [Balneolaceae bacterium]|nr:MAG: efflux RND transporter periplasmic adaptor subunit [Balneolaceae bacterium]
MLKKGITLGIAFLLSIAMISCDGEAESSENNNNGVRLMPVETVTIEQGDFEDFIRLTGTVEALEDATISAEVSGRILSISNRGDRVNRGGVIARLDDRVIQAQFDAAKTGFELAEDTFNRLEALYADSIISTQDFRSARAQRDQAKAQLNQAEKMLQDSNIEAPFSGRIEDRMVRTGELINPGMPVVRLVNTSRVRVLAGIPERFAGEIGEGSEVEIRIRSFGGDAIESRISHAGNVIDPDTRTFTVEIELENPGERIKPDMVVDLRVKRSKLTDVIIIPRTAVLRDEEGVSVFRSAESDGRKVAELVAVRTGLASGALIQIVEGIEVGDEIVVSGMRTLSAGDELNVITNESNLERAERLQAAERPVASF